MHISLHSKNVAEAAAYRRGWSRIWGSVRGGIYLVPTETSKIIVQTSPELKISCVLPAKTRKISASWDKKHHVEVDVQTPDLVLHQVLYRRDYCCSSPDCTYCKGHFDVCFCETCLKRTKRPSCAYYLYELLEGDDSIRIRNYRIGNIATDGAICFGSQTISPVMRQANFNYWNSSFNNDYPDVWGETHEHAVSHSRRECVARRGGVKVKHTKGDPYFAPHPIGRYRKCFKQIKCVCDRPASSCRCACICPCCKGTCDCACQCKCCVGSCNCCCSCDKNEIFAGRLKGYTAAKSTIRDGNPIICGRDYLASSRRTDGVFISQDEDVLAELPDEAKTLLKGRFIAIGLAIKLEDGWRLDFRGGYTDTCSDREVHLV